MSADAPARLERSRVARSATTASPQRKQAYRRWQQAPQFRPIQASRPRGLEVLLSAESSTLAESVPLPRFGSLLTAADLGDNVRVSQWSDMFAGPYGLIYDYSIEREWLMRDVGRDGWGIDVCALLASRSVIGGDK